MIFTERAALQLVAMWGFQPHTPAYFSLAGKVGKRAHRGGTLSMGSRPYVPHPRDDTKGARPLWNPPQDFYLSCCPPDTPEGAFQEKHFDQHPEKHVSL